MKRSEFEALGTKHKKFEHLHRTMLLEGIPTMCRLDGRAFHTFTRGFDKPFDDKLTKAMQETTAHLIKKFHADIGVTQSDEISLVFLPNHIMFGGVVDKINTTLAATASVFFNKVASELGINVDSLPTFDCRTWQLPTLDLCVENLLWRETDATRNSLSMVCQSLFSQTQLSGKNSKEQHDMLHSIGVNWNDYPVRHKRGSYLKRMVKTDAYIEDAVWNKIPEKNRPESRFVTRSVVEVVELPPIHKIPVGVMSEFITMGDYQHNYFERLFGNFA